MALTPPNATYSDDLYRFHWTDIEVECIVERLVQEKTDIRCELTVTIVHPIRGGRLYSGQLLLMGPNSRRNVKSELSERMEEVDWGGILEQVCNLSRDRYRRGEPVVDLATVEYKTRARFLLEPFIVHGGIAIAYGDGKTAKSLFQLYNCVRLAQAGVRSLYLDWEDDAETHAERLSAICSGMDIEKPCNMIDYQRRSARLADSVREIRRHIAEHAIGHVVIDSLGMAAGGANSEETIMPAMTAMRAMGTAVTAIHHLPKDAKDKTKPLGSVYSSNEARITWLFEKADEANQEQMTLLLTNHAFNRGGRLPPQAFKMGFVNDGDDLIAVHIEGADARQLELMRKRKPHHKLIYEVLLKNGRLNPKDISLTLAAEEIEIAEPTVRAILNRHAGDWFVKFGEVWAAMSRAAEPV